MAPQRPSLQVSLDTLPREAGSMEQRPENEERGAEGPAGFAVGHRTLVSVEEAEPSEVLKVPLPKCDVNKTEFQSTKSFESKH